MTEDDRERVEEAQIMPLFDPMPRGLEYAEKRIMSTYDGTLGRQGIIMVLEPRTGAFVRANLVDLESGVVTVYEELTRGKWISRIGEFLPGSREYLKMERVLDDTKTSLTHWKDANPSALPMREWTTRVIRKPANPFVPGEAKGNVNAKVVEKRPAKQRAIDPREFEEYEEEPEPEEPDSAPKKPKEMSRKRRKPMSEIRREADAKRNHEGSINKLFRELKIMGLDALDTKKNPFK